MENAFLRDSFNVERSCGGAKKCQIAGFAVPHLVSDEMKSDNLDCF